MRRPSHPRGAISPPVPLKGPVRFVFIGSDALTQNRLTIDYLLDLWRRHAIAAPLVFFGLQSRTLDLPANVSVAGYVDSIAQVYDGHSVLLTPSMIGGGVKTKVLEAFAHGAPVIANALTFESMPIGDYPLNISEESALVGIVGAPERHMALFDRAAEAGAAYLARFHGAETFAASWRRVMDPEAVTLEAPVLQEGHG
jgi:glycosyltransferase involved in cell wall biosynthesis